MKSLIALSVSGTGVNFAIGEPRKGIYEFSGPKKCSSAITLVLQNIIAVLGRVEAMCQNPGDWRIDTPPSMPCESAIISIETETEGREQVTSIVMRPGVPISFSLQEAGQNVRLRVSVASGHTPNGPQLLAVLKEFMPGINGLVAFLAGPTTQSEKIVASGG
jgi:hypothetical protein